MEKEKMKQRTYFSPSDKVLKNPGVLAGLAAPIRSQLSLKDVELSFLRELEMAVENGDLEHKENIRVALSVLRSIFKIDMNI